MSDDSYEIAACRGKAGYLTWDLAKRAISRNRFTPQKNGRGRVAIYRCRFCSHWHVGTSSSNRKNKD